MEAPGGDETPRSSNFPTTQWSLVLVAGVAGGNRALAELCRSYWPPLYAYVRRRGFAAADAAGGRFHLQYWARRWGRGGD